MVLSAQEGGRVRPSKDAKDKLDWAVTVNFTKADYFRVLRFVEARKEKMAVFARKAVLEKVEKEATE